jgi:hypothetical protein
MVGSDGIPYVIWLDMVGPGHCFRARAGCVSVWLRLAAGQPICQATGPPISIHKPAPSVVHMALRTPHRRTPRLRGQVDGFDRRSPCERLAISAAAAEVARGGSKLRRLNGSRRCDSARSLPLRVSATRSTLVHLQRARIGAWMVGRAPSRPLRNPPSAAAAKGDVHCARVEDADGGGPGTARSPMVLSATWRLALTQFARRHGGFRFGAAKCFGCRAAPRRVKRSQWRRSARCRAPGAVLLSPCHAHHLFDASPPLLHAHRVRGLLLARNIAQAP